jgi:uncharacterized protein YjbJ (UPF0337 family)
MDENRISGTVRNGEGKAEEAVGRVTGDLKKQFQGKLDQAAGAAQEFYGQTADAAATPQSRSTSGCAQRLRRSPIRRRWWHLASAGCSAEHIGRFKSARYAGTG